MEKTLKTIAKVVLTTIAIAAFLVMLSEAESHQLLWSLGSMATLALAGKGLDLLGCFDK